MRSHPAEPVGGVPCIRLLAVDDPVPETTLGRSKVLCDAMCLVPAGEVKIKSAQGSFGRAGTLEQIRSRKRSKAAACLFGGAVDSCEGQQTLAATIQIEERRHAAPI